MSTRSSVLMGLAGARGVAYPGRHLGRWLEQAMRQKIREGSGPESAADIARWLGHGEVTRLNKWVKGRLLPKPEDYPDLARLGLAVEQIHELVAHDRMQALAMDEGLDEAALLKVAASIAHLGGMSKEQVIALLQEADLEELERALTSS